MNNPYILPNGEELDLSKIDSIDEVKSVRSRTFKRLGYWYFTIYFNDKTKKDYAEDYDYYNWIKVRHRLENIQEEILEGASLIH